MKQKDIALIIAIVFASAVLSLVVGRFVFAQPKNRQQSVEVVDAISTQFTLPDGKYLNNQSINPTQLIQISENSNGNPFTSGDRQ